MNHNFHGQKKTSIRENESIYFYPDGIQRDSDHSVVVIENTTSHKINDQLWQKTVNAPLNKDQNIWQKVNNFANSN